MSTHQNNFWKSGLFFFLDILFPTSAKIKRLEKMGISQIRQRKSVELHNLPSWVTTSLSYKDSDIRTMIWQMKYKKNIRFIDIFSEILSEEIIQKFSELQEMYGTQSVLIVPIPMHKTKKRKRGFNQTEILAKKVTDQIEQFKYAPYILKKVKNTQSQTKMRNKKARLENLENSFKTSDPKNIKGQTIFLIDDVVTTGATLTEARKVLKKSGARKIEAFTIAH